MRLIKYIIVISTGLFLRSTISLNSYSGHNKPTMFGDFEAQRHWQEVTVNLPIKEWYKNTTNNDLLYWGLDYPPLTAYHSFIIGCAAKVINESYVTLDSSRGIETNDHKFFMRLTVLIGDQLLYIPAILIASNIIFYEVLRMNSETSEEFYWLYIFINICYPGQILIDNGHFQYNNISLGLTAMAISAILINKRIIGAILFVMALNYKQMELYHAIPFFCYLLSNCFFEYGHQKKHSKIDGFFRLFTLGFVVIVFFLIIWAPWLYSMDSLFQVINRIFPLNRGVFEDKVASIWCLVNIFVKIKENFSNEEMAKICLLCTGSFLVPSSINLLYRPNKKQFIYALINSSLAFFLFSFQVHEKSILIAALPIGLIFPVEPFITFWFLQVSTFSMLPLLKKDGLISAFIGLSTVTFFTIKLMIKLVSKNNKELKSMHFLMVLFKINFNEKKHKYLEIIMITCYVFSTVLQFVLLISFFYLKPPEKLPFLYQLLISAFSCCHFLFFFVYFNIRQVFMK